MLFGSVNKSLIHVQERNRQCATGYTYMPLNPLIIAHIRTYSMYIYVDDKDVFLTAPNLSLRWFIF